MKFSASREAFLKPLQAVIGVVERRQTMPILSNVLLNVADGKVSVTATDLEVELLAEATIEQDKSGEITVPGRKLHDICRALPEGSKVELSLSGERLTVKAGRSRFTLSTLRAGDFPSIEEVTAVQTLTVKQSKLQELLERTQFSMAQQDVRYYLNGLLLETADSRLRAVATDGHRLALSEIELDTKVEQEGQVIVPRKGVLELSRLLGDEGEVALKISANHVQVEAGAIRLTSKLIDGRFPDYARVIPAEAENLVKADRGLLRQALQRAAILSNEKYRGVRLELGQNMIVIQANNPEQEEAVESLEVEYAGNDLEIGFNVTYLLDALNAVEGEVVEIGLNDGNSSCLIRTPGDNATKYVVMPMRL